MPTLIDGVIARGWMTEFTLAFARDEQRLTELDRLAGDGDFGTNIAAALRRVADVLPPAETATYRTVFSAASRGFLATGGTSGPLFGMWFRQVSQAGTVAATAAQLAAGVAAGLETIQQLGGAKIGDNTMIDALAPASGALSAAAGQGLTLLESMEAAADAARTGALSTGDLVAHRGRASYVGELARGVLDPGAVTVALFFDAGAAVVGSERERPEILAGVRVHP